MSHSGHPAKVSAMQGGQLTPPKFNSEFAPEKWYLEDDPASYWASGNF